MLSQSTTRALCRHCRRASTTIQALAGRPPAHTSLVGFLRYAQDLPLDRASTVFRGTLYEYAVLECLRQHSFDVFRTGGADDKGIDLRGHWRLPVPRSATQNKASVNDSSGTTLKGRQVREIPVVIQCKHEVKKMGPRVVREVGGIRTLATTLDTEEEPCETLRILASSSPFTEKAVQAMMTSASPILLCLICAPASISNDLATASKPTRGQAKKPVEQEELETLGVLKQAIWNVAAAKIIGSEVIVRLVHSAEKGLTPSAEPVLKLYCGSQILSKKAR